MIDLEISNQINFEEKKRYVYGNFKLLQENKGPIKCEYPEGWVGFLDFSKKFTPPSTSSNSTFYKTGLIRVAQGLGALGVLIALKHAHATRTNTALEILYQQKNTPAFVVTTEKDLGLGRVTIRASRGFASIGVSTQEDSLAQKGSESKLGGEKIRKSSKDGAKKTNKKTKVNQKTSPSESTKNVRKLIIAFGPSFGPSLERVTSPPNSSQKVNTPAISVTLDDFSKYKFSTKDVVDFFRNMSEKNENLSHSLYLLSRMPNGPYKTTRLKEVQKDLISFSGDLIRFIERYFSYSFRKVLIRQNCVKLKLTDTFKLPADYSMLSGVHSCGTEIPFTIERFEKEFIQPQNKGLTKFFSESCRNLVAIHNKNFVKGQLPESPDLETLTNYYDMLLDVSRGVVWNPFFKRHVEFPDLRERDLSHSSAISGHVNEASSSQGAPSSSHVPAGPERAPSQASPGEDTPSPKKVVTKAALTPLTLRAFYQPISKVPLHLTGGYHFSGQKADLGVAVLKSTIKNHQKRGWLVSGQVSILSDSGFNFKNWKLLTSIFLGYALRF